MKITLIIIVVSVVLYSLPFRINPLVSSILWFNGSNLVIGSSVLLIFSWVSKRASNDQKPWLTGQPTLEFQSRSRDSAIHFDIILSFFFTRETWLVKTCHLKAIVHSMKYIYILPLLTSIQRDVKETWVNQWFPRDTLFQFQLKLFQDWLWKGVLSHG